MSGKPVETDGVMVPAEWTHPAERHVYAGAINKGFSREDAAWLAATVRSVRNAGKRSATPTEGHSAPEEGP